MEEQLSSEEALKFFVVLLFVREVVIAPILCYFLYNFWKYQKLEFIYRRRPLLTIVVITCSIVEVAFIPICRYELMFRKKPDLRHVYNWVTLFDLIHETLIIPRFWFLYFDWQLGKDLTKSEWKQQLYLGQLHVYETIGDTTETAGQSPTVELQNPSPKLSGTASGSDLCEFEKSVSPVAITVPVPVTVPANTYTGSIITTVWNADTKKMLTIVREDINRRRSENERKETPWTLRYRRYLGNTYLVLAVFALLFVGFLGMVITLGLLESFYDVSIFATSYSFCTAVILVMCASKIKRCHDLLEIQSELKLLTLNVMVWVALLVVGLVIFPQCSYERQLCLMACMAGLHSINGMIMLRPKNLYYTVHENSRCRWNCFRIRKRYASKFKSGQNCSSSDLKAKPKNGNESPSRETSGNRQAIELSYQITLEEILSEKHGFELFASHLVRELSLENVLFLVEYMQLKHFITVHQLQAYVQDIGYLVPIYDGLLQKSLHSGLLQTNMPSSTALFVCFDMFRYLYSYYIMDGAMALLNLDFGSSSSISHQILELKQNPTSETLQPLLYVFDGAARDIVRLLRGDSFYRFQLSRECVKYCEGLL